MRAFCYVLILAVVAVYAVPASAQLAPLYGKVIGEDGKPVADADVLMISNDSGRQYKAKTGKKGEFVVVNIAAGLYQLTISKDGKVLFEAHGKRVEDQKDLEINLVKERTAALERETPEQRQKRLEEQQAAEKERTNVRSMNDLLARASAASDAGDFANAASSIKQAIQIDPSKDVLWARLGEAYLSAAGKASAGGSRDTATEDYTQAVDAYKKAISIKPAEAGYHNNLGQALAKLQKTEEAAAEYITAAQLDPAHAGTYYFNLGAILTNAGKTDEANAAFDRAIAADPKHSEAYYWKGVNLLGKATLDKSGKMVAPPGTADAFRKYLELEPSGRYASAAKEMLGTIGEKVETTFTKGKSK